MNASARDAQFPITTSKEGQNNNQKKRIKRSVHGLPRIFYQMQYVHHLKNYPGSCVAWYIDTIKQAGHKRAKAKLKGQSFPPN